MHSRWTIEHRRNFLQRVSLCLREEEPRNSKDHSIKAAKKDIVMPSNVFQRDRIDKGQYNQRSVDTQQIDSNTLAACRVGEYFRGIAQQQRRVGDVVVEVEDEDKANDCVAQGGVLRLLEKRGADRPDDEGYQHADRRPQKKSSPAEIVDEKRCS